MPKSAPETPTPARAATLHLGGRIYAHPDLAPLVRPLYDDAGDPVIRRHPNNPRKGDQEALAKSVLNNGVYSPMKVQRSTGYVLAGNHTLDAHLDGEATSAAWVWLDVDDDEARRIMLDDNHVGDLGGYDDRMLLESLRAAEAAGDLLLSSYTVEDIGDLEAALAAAAYNPPAQTPTLADRFLVPPFTVLDARSGAWQDRKRRWLALGIQSEVGRGETITQGGNSRGAAGGGGLAEVGLPKEERRALDQARRDRKTLGAVQTNLDGVDAARYGRTATRQVSSPYSKGNPRTDEVSAKIAATSARTLGQGLQAHRDPDTGDLVYTETTAAGVSIFDPVLCELAYRWFTPPGGHVLDPFAGGSVRGIVAAALGHPYTGVELRPEQVAANEAQMPIVDRMRPRGTPAAPTTVKVKVSAASARQTFHGCEPDYIRDVCHGRCCRSPQASTGTGTLITIHPSEEAAIAARGGEVVDGLLQPREGEHRCPFQSGEDHLCGLHTTPDKPFGCIASPFTLNGNDTLIVRNRYRMLGCYKDTRPDGTQLPAYVAFRASLNLIFGEAEAQRIHDHLAAGGGDLIATMPAESHRRLTDNDAIKHGTLPGPAPSTPEAIPRPTWVLGDSRTVVPALDVAADLVFSCPPYADLEVYSDDPADLSAMPYDDFLTAYRAIIAAAVDRLRNDRFAVWVIGEVRDRRGLYRGLVPDTIRAFTDAGAALYNEAILVTPVGSLPIRAGRQFAAGRKLGKTHQNVLVFCKGDPRAAADACGTVEVTMPDVEPEVV